MLDQALRPLKDRVLAPLARAVGPSVHPTVITLAGFAMGVGCAVSLYAGAYGAGLALWLANRLLDGLDGLVARSTHRQTELGGYVDLLLDFAVYAAVPIALVHGRLAPGPGAGLALAVLLAGFYINAASWMYLSAVLEKRSAAGPARPSTVTSIRMPAGIVEGTETIIIFSAFMLFPGQLAMLFWTMSALLLATVAQRLVWAARRLSG